MAKIVAAEEVEYQKGVWGEPIMFGIVAMLQQNILSLMVCRRGVSNVFQK